MAMSNALDLFFGEEDDMPTEGWDLIMAKKAESVATDKAPLHLPKAFLTLPRI